MSERYYVVTVDGYTIGRGTSVGSTKPKTSASVLDQYDCHREVATFKGLASEALATLACLRLNAIERAHERDVEVVQ